MGRASGSTELCPLLRANIVGAWRCSVKVAQIARQFELKYSTVYSTVQRYSTSVTYSSDTRKGRPPKVNARIKRIIVRAARKSPKLSWTALRFETGTTYCSHTFKRILEEYGIYKWLAVRKCILTKEGAAKRLAWALERASWTTQDFSKVIFSDEASCEKGGSIRREYMMRTPEQKWLPDFLQTTKKGKGLRIMVQGAIIYGKRSDLIIIDRDAAAAKFSYTSTSYIATLDDRIWSLQEPGLIFMQDNAPIHKSKVTTTWLKEHYIKVWDQPPNSPDLNPIENLQAELKRLLLVQRPDLIHYRSRSEASENEWAEALNKAWESIPQDYINKLIQSMPRRVKAVIDAEGWQTKYQERKIS